MELDWVTIIAQMLNFLVLLWLLKKFLYRPILKAIDARDAEIASRLEAAAQQAQQAATELESLQNERNLLENDRTAYLEKARQEAELLSEQLVDEAKKNAEASRLKWQNGLESERRSFAKESALIASSHIATLANKVLEDLAGETLEKQMVDAFTRAMTAIDKERRTDLVAALLSGKILIESSHTLKKSERLKIQESLEKLCEKTVNVEYRIDKKIKSGLRLSSGGREVEWSIDSYINSYEKAALKALDQDNAQGNLTQTDLKAAGT